MSSLSRKSLLLFIAIMMTMLVGFVATENAYADDIDVYVTVERTLIKNQDPILEPFKVTVPSGSTVVDVLDEVKSEKGSTVFNYTMVGSVANDTAYITGFLVNGHPASFNWLNDYPFVSEYNAATNNMGYVYWNYGSNPPESSTYLSEGDYNMLGGWIVSENNTITWDDDATSVNEATPRASSTITQNNTVLRFQYSCALCRDCGYQGWNLLTLSSLANGFYTAADKSALVRAMADALDKTSTAYTNGMAVLKNMTATDAQVAAAVAAF